MGEGAAGTKSESRRVALHPDQHSLCSQTDRRALRISPLLVELSQHTDDHGGLWAGHGFEAVPLCSLVDEHALELACGDGGDRRGGGEGGEGGEGAGGCGGGDGGDGAGGRAGEERLELLGEHEQEHPVL